MRIGLDARWIFPQISGIGSYTGHLIEHLALEDRHNEYVLFFDHAEVMQRVMEIPAVHEASHFTAHRLHYSPFSPQSQLLMPGLLKKLRIDVYHSTNYMIPFLAFPRQRTGEVKCVTTIHDLIPLLFPELTPKAKKTRFYPVFKWVIMEAAKRADMIIVPSQSSRKDVIEHLNISSAQHEQVVIIEEGVSSQYQPAGQKNGKAPTVLYVGRLDPYKNVTLLVHAFAHVLKKVPGACLRIIGPEDPRYPEARRTAKELNLHNAITWNGYVTGDELRKAYQQAHVFVLPSRYEGFGLPVLEAMASGTPVICGNASSLPDVAGDAAILIDPDDADGLAADIVRVLTDPALAETLRHKGLSRARQFTWTRAAQETIAAYERVSAL